MVSRTRRQRRVRRSKPAIRRKPSSSVLASRAEAKQQLSTDSSLKIGGAHDPAEKAADHLADRVMRMPSTPSVIHRKCDACADEDKQKLQRSSGNSGIAAGAKPATASVATAKAINSMGSGRPMAKTERAFFEPRFNADFSDVRIHESTAANKVARSIDAKAFSLGNDIAFAEKENAGNRKLLAHELAHAVQEDESKIRRSSGGDGEQEEETEPTADTVYLCSKELDTSPVGSHAFFRIGSPDAGNTTYSLQPRDAGSGCWQGVKGINYSSDYNADGECERTSISLSSLQSEHASYPTGHYCTWGPNSNTFVGVLARNCGMSDPDPVGWTPGITDSAPPSGTYAPDKWSTLTGCTTHRCERNDDGVLEPVPPRSTMTPDGVREDHETGRITVKPMP